MKTHILGIAVLFRGSLMNLPVGSSLSSWLGLMMLYGNHKVKFRTDLEDSFLNFFAFLVDWFVIVDG